MRCDFKGCPNDAVSRVVEIRDRAVLRHDRAICAHHSDLLWQSYASDSRKGLGKMFELAGATPFELELLMADYQGGLGKALVRQVGGQQLVHFPIAYVGASILYQSVLGSPYNQFTIHAVLKKVVEGFGGELSHVLINRINSEGYFEATTVFLKEDQLSEVRILPSDGLALAIMTGLPFMVSDDVAIRSHEISRVKL